MSLEIYTELNQLNQQLNALLGELIAALESEHELLLQPNSEELTETALVKKQLSDHINTIDQQRTQLIKQTGLKNNKQDLTRLSEIACAHVPDFSENWQATEQLIKQCADKNQVNGIIMENNRRNIESRLSILRGQPLSADSYTSNGRKSSGPDTRSLAHA